MSARPDGFELELTLEPGAHPGWSHAIVSVSAARCGALRSWRRVGDELVEERRVSERRAPRRSALP